MSTSLGRPRQPNPSTNLQTTNVSALLAQVLGQYIPGYTFITDVARDKLGIDPDKLLAVLGFIFGGWALFNYIQNIVLPRVLGSLTSSLILERNDQTYEDFTNWISKRRIFQYARSIRVVGRQGEHKPMYQNPWSPFSRGETFLSKSLDQDYSYAEEQDENALFDFAALEAKRPLLFEPQAGTYWFFFKRRLFLFSKNSDPVSEVSSSSRRGTSGAQSNNISLTCVGLSTKPLKDLMETARAENYENQAFRTSIFRPGGMNRFDRYTSGPSPWMKVASRPSRPLESVVLSRDQKEQILTDWNSFLHPKRQAWFSSRGIPYRRGYLFSGPPGTGKTSICYALAGVFGVDVFVVALGDANLSDADLTGLLTDLPTRCIVVLEDIDCVGSQRTEDDDDEEEGIRLNQPQRAMSLSGLLNAIDGVGAHEGHILVMTTNHPDVLDEALKRPGRIDMHLGFTRATRRQIEEIFIRMYSVSDDPEQQPGRKRRNMTVQTACRESSELTFERSCPYMSNDELIKAAKTIAGAFEDEQFSPAEIQGFLLMHKSDPHAAVAKVTTWIPEQLAAREKARITAEKAKERRATKHAEMLARRDELVAQNSMRASQGLPLMAQLPRAPKSASDSSKPASAGKQEANGDPGNSEDTAADATAAASSTSDGEEVDTKTDAPGETPKAKGKEVENLNGTTETSAMDGDSPSATISLNDSEAPITTSSSSGSGASTIVSSATTNGAVLEVKEGQYRAGYSG